MFICKDQYDLEEAYSQIVADRLIIEEYFDVPNEFVLKGFSIKGGEEIIFTNLKKWKYKDKSKKGFMYFEPCNDNALLNRISNLIKSANYSGIFDAEFLQKEDGELIFL